MKKRILCAIMSAVMVVGMMTGCGSKETTSNKTVENVSDKTEEKYVERMEAYLDYFQSEEKDYDGIVGAAITLDSDSLPLLWLGYKENIESEDIRFQLCSYEKNKIEILAEKKIRNVNGVYPYLGMETIGLHLDFDDGDGDDPAALIYDSEKQDFKFYDVDYFENVDYFDSSNYKNEDDIEKNYEAMINDLDVYRIFYRQLEFIILKNQDKTAYVGELDRNNIYFEYLDAIGALDESTSTYEWEMITPRKLSDKYKDNEFVSKIFNEHFSLESDDRYFVRQSIYLPDGTETDEDGMFKYLDIVEDDLKTTGVSFSTIGYFTVFFGDKDAESLMRRLIKEPAYTAFDMLTIYGKEVDDNDWKFGDIVDVKELLNDAADSKDNSVDSTESIRREDSTEISKETNNNMPDWKQAYIDYFNNSNLNVLDSKFIDTENKDIHLLACSIDNGSIDGKLFYINKKNEVVEIATYTLNRAVVRYNKYGCISILTTPTVYDSSFAVYKYDENSGSYPETYEGFAALDQDSFSKDGDMKYNCKINGNECDYESYQIEWNTYETGTGFEFIELSEASVGVSVIDTIKNY